MILVSLIAGTAWAPWVRPDEVSLDLWVNNDRTNQVNPILLDLERDAAGWRPKAWAFWYPYNKGDHPGTIQARKLADGREELKIDLTVRPDIWVPGGSASLTLRLKKEANRYVGDFQGTWVGKPIQGELEGSRPSPFMAKHPGFKVWKQGEHPRLLFRASELRNLKKRTKTTEGQAILARMKTVIQLPFTGRTAGFVAAAHAFLYLLEGNKAHLDAATDLVLKTIENRVGNDDLWISQDKMIRRAQPPQGVALTYDLLYNEWTPELRERVAKALEAKQDDLIMGGGTGFNLAPWSNWQGISRGSMGLTALAILGDPGSTERTVDNLRIAERSMRRFIRFGVGSGGYFHEGDGYLRYSTLEGVFPFVATYRNVMGIDLVKETGLRRIIPNITQRAVQRDDRTWVIPAYGPGGSEWGPSGTFILGLATATSRDRAVAKGTFDQILGLAGDRSFDIFEERPDLGIWALTSYPFGTSSARPETTLKLFHKDPDKSYYLARNHWGPDAVSVGYYLKREPRTSSWSLQDAGAFKIAGLGVEWATKADPDKNDRVSENVISVGEANTSGPGIPTHEVSYPDGSFVVTANLDNAYRTNAGQPTASVKHTRSFLADLAPAEGSVAVFAIYDKLSGEGAKVWRMHTRAEVTVKGNQFVIRKGIKALVGRVTRPAGAKLSVQGRSLIITNPDPSQRDQEFLVVMALQDRIRPEALTESDGVRVDNISYGLVGDRLRLPR